MQKENKKSFKKYIVPSLLILNLLLTSYLLVYVAMLNREMNATFVYTMQRFYADEEKAGVKNTGGEDIIPRKIRFEKHYPLRYYFSYPIDKVFELKNN